MVDTFLVQPKRGEPYKTTDYRNTLGKLFTDGYLPSELNQFDIDNSFGNLTFKVKTGRAVIGGVFVELSALSDSKSIPASSTRQVFISLTLNGSLRVTGAQIEILTSPSVPTTPYIQIAELTSNATIITTVTQTMRVNPKANAAVVPADTSQAAYKAADQTITSGNTADVTSLALTLPNTGKTVIIIVVLNWSSPTIGAAIIAFLNDNGADVLNPTVACHQQVANYQSMAILAYKTTANGQIVKVKATVSGGNVTVYGNGTHSISHIVSYQGGN